MTTTRSMLYSNSEPLSQSVWTVAVGVVATLAAVSARYGFHRDELYLTAAGRNLDWGYVDQPPALPGIARLLDSTAGVSPMSLRVLPALCAGAITLLVGWMAGRMGARPVGQMVAALAGGGSAYTLAVGHLFGTTIFDALGWTIALALLVAILDRGSPRLWVAFGATLGIGFYFKHLIAVLPIVAIPLILILRPKVARGIWPWVGLAVTAILVTPGVLWQRTNDWPQLEMSRALSNNADPLSDYLLLTLALFSVVLVIPLVGGFIQIWRDVNLKRWRALTLLFPILLVGFAVAGGKAYYAFPAAFPILAGAAIWYEERRPARRRGLLMLMLLGLAAGAVVALPILEPDQATFAMEVNPELGETVGWSEEVDQIRAVFASLDSDEQATAVIYTRNYGQAGAIEVLGPDLPPAYSGHNSFWHWGPPTSHGLIIGVGRVAADLAPICPNLEQVGTVTNPWKVENQEFGAPIYLCREPTGALASIWEDLKAYG